MTTPPSRQSTMVRFCVFSPVHCLRYCLLVLRTCNELVIFPVIEFYNGNNALDIIRDRLEEDDSLEDRTPQGCRVVTVVSQVNLIQFQWRIL